MAGLTCLQSLFFIYRGLDTRAAVAINGGNDGFYVFMDLRVEQRCVQVSYNLNLKPVTHSTPGNGLLRRTHSILDWRHSTRQRTLNASQSTLGLLEQLSNVGTKIATRITILNVRKFAVLRLRSSSRFKPS